MSSFNTPPRRLADLIRPHKVLIPPPEPIIVAPKRPNFIPASWSWHPEDQIIRPPMGPFDPTKMRLYLSPQQKGKNDISGTDLSVELKGLPVLGADDLDRLLAEPYLIPDSWKSKRTFFWGDIYRRPAGTLCVHYLEWGVDRWRRDYDWLDSGWWNANRPAAVCSS